MTKEAIENATSYINNVKQYYPEEHPACLSAYNNIAIIKKGSGE